MPRIVTPQERQCRFIEDPSNECYVVRLRSQDIVNAIYYCGGEFEECEIYRKRLCDTKEETRGDEDEDRLSCQCQHTGKPHERKVRAGS